MKYISQLFIMQNFYVQLNSSMKICIMNEVRGKKNPRIGWEIKKSSDGRSRIWWIPQGEFKKITRAFWGRYVLKKAEYSEGELRLSVRKWECGVIQHRIPKQSMVSGMIGAIQEFYWLQTKHSFRILYHSYYITKI